MHQKKYFSQVFLKNSAVANKMVNTIPVTCSQVLEIGPGKGILTALILKKEHDFFGLEIDRHWAGFLQQKYSDYRNFCLHQGDALTYNITNFGTLFCAEPCYIISNIPYNITGPLLFRLLAITTDKTMIVAGLTLMMQYEVGQRLLATPQNKVYGFLTIIFNHYYSIKKICVVKKEAFTPVPKVNSIVLQLIPKVENCANFKMDRQLFVFIKKMFMMKRKTILNNLSYIINDKNQAKNVLKNLKLNYNLRSEQLNFNHFQKIFSQVKSIVTD